MSNSHATRTCHYCGLRKPQPDMQRREIMVDTGRSRSSMSIATFIGAALGNRGSQRSILRTIFNSAGRKYQRRKDIWACGQEVCPGGVAPARTGIGLKPKLMLGGGLVFAIIAASVYLGLL
jgi:hypothetical protein